MPSHQTVLVTGATGFIGAAVAAETLRSAPGSRLLYLVRAADRTQGLQRLRASLRRFAVAEAVLDAMDETQIVCGDLESAPRWLQEPAARAVTRLVNCAGHASFGQDATVWQVNARDTFALLQGALRLPRLERLVQVGTAMSCGPGAATPVAESWESADERAHFVGYTASKAALERRAHRELADPRLVFARPSIVIGHTALGCRPSGSLFWIFRVARALGGFTCALGDRIDVVPVDYCAHALVHLAFKERLEHRLYHVSAGDRASCSYGEIDRAYAAALALEPLGEAYRMYAPRELAREAVRRAALLGIDEPRLAARALTLYGAFASLDYAFDNARLLGEGVPPPPRFSRYLAACALSSEGVSITEQMRFDVKRPQPARMAAAA